MTLSRPAWACLTLVLPLIATPALAAGGQGMMDHAEIGEPGDPAAVSETVEIVMNDNYFEPESVAVKAGSTVRFVVTNEGGLLHEFNLGTSAMQGEMQGEMAMLMEHGVISETTAHHDMEGMDHGQMGGMDMGEMMAMLEAHPNRVLVEPGETKELVWTFAQDMELEFACNLPGRYDSGMVGELKVGE
ncbi:MAG: cupredoxin domain-containing protein [Alphaproteobacteria bacterium]